MALFKEMGQIGCSSLVAGYTQTPLVINWSVYVSHQTLFRIWSDVVIDV